MKARHMSCALKKTDRTWRLPGARRKAVTIPPRTASVLTVDVTTRPRSVRNRRLRRRNGSPPRRPPPVTGSGPPGLPTIAGGSPGAEGNGVTPAEVLPSAGTAARSGLDHRDRRVHAQVLLRQPVEHAGALEDGDRLVDALDQPVPLLEEQAVVLVRHGELPDDGGVLDLCCRDVLRRRRVCDEGGDPVVDQRRLHVVQR